MPPRLGLHSSSETISISHSVSAEAAPTTTRQGSDSPNSPTGGSSATTTIATSMPQSSNNNNNINKNIHRHFELKLYRQQSSFRFVECQGWLTNAWIIHFIACIIAIIIGLLASSSSSSGGFQRKYVPIDVNTIEQDCTRAFVNVFSESINDPGALYCCNNSNSNNNSNSKQQNPMICEPPPWFLFFAGRLSRFPDAWLLPLFPLFFRGLVIFVRRITKQLPSRGGVHSYKGYSGSSSSSTSTSNSKSDLIHAKHRFLFYIILIQIRGWILYLLFDQIEDMFMSSSSTSMTYDRQHHHQQPTYFQEQQDGSSSCWYKELLHPHHSKKSNHSNSSNCHGRDLDFSDHMVLYYAQILPIALTEVLHSFVLPYWETHKDRVYCGRKRHNSIIPWILLCFLLNLYLITFYGVYKTSVYFHTIPEVVMGYVVSLCIQIPLFLLQCTTTFSPQAREWLYGYSIS